MVGGTSAIIDLALREDIGHRDVTTHLLVNKEARGTARMRAKETFVLAGSEIVSQVFVRLGGDVKTTLFYEDGAEVHAGDAIAELKGSLRVLLGGERTALNFLQRLSGVATETRRIVKKVEGYPVRILDTRKTTPGWRALEKEAVRIGGGYNHRWGLYDGILIKDNHIGVAGGIVRAVERARLNAPLLAKIEVEVSTLREVEEALRAGADVIMLDNMSITDMKKAVDFINKRALVEASGGITFENVEAIARTGVDFVSMGALTTASRAVDITMEVERYLE
ncbi:MAG: carboxylating nicotinate-nucleotide diphosphorylase [Deltaproteobacteria bacterium]|nr:carboxylating nicotinate-nucleotide diphosphorylase [Deltaproteobacteria bacterium]